MAIGAEVLIAVTAGDLVIALHAGHHEQLLEQLRALRQRVERAGLQPGRDQEVARPLRCGPGQRGCLNLDEVVGCQHVPGSGIDAGAQPERIARSAVSAHIQVAVLQPGFLACRLIELEGQGGALPQHRQRYRVDLDVAGRDIRIGIALGADLHDTGDGEAELGA